MIIPPAPVTALPTPSPIFINVAGSAVAINKFPALAEEILSDAAPPPARVIIVFGDMLPPFFI